MKRANHGTKLQGTPGETPAEPPTAQTGKNPKDAQRLIADLVKETVKQLQKQGLVRKP